MLQKNKMVIESLYTGRCTVTEYQKVKRANHSTGFEEVVVLTNIPCRLSYKSFPVTQEGVAPKLTQATKLFISPGIEIKAGSKIEVTQSGKTNVYKASSQPAFYSSHQEISLELFDGWA